jgi:hypothetical protein
MIARAFVATLATVATLASTAEADAAPRLPAAVQSYVDAVNRNQLERLAHSFAPGATIIDVSRRIVGRAAIRRWAQNEVMGGRLRVLRVAKNPRGRPGLTLLVRWAPSGSGGFEAHYRFVVRDGVIVLADLQYA